MKPTPKADALRALREARASKSRVELLKKWTAAPAAKPIPAPVQASAPSKETNVKKPKTKKAAKPLTAKQRGKSANASIAKAKKADARAAKPDGENKTGQVVAMIQRPEGCTAAEVCAATGWKAVSIPPIAKRANIKLRKEKDGRGVRYFADAA